MDTTGDELFFSWLQLKTTKSTIYSIKLGINFSNYLENTARAICFKGAFYSNLIILKGLRPLLVSFLREIFTAKLGCASHILKIFVIFAIFFELI